MKKLKNSRVVNRLSRYKNALYRFRDLGFGRVYSDHLAEEIGVTPSQVRKDFSVFKITGNKRAGYQIDELLAHLEAIFRKDVEKRSILVGAGRLGSALTNYRGLNRGDMKIMAVFDVDPSKLRKNDPIPVLDIAVMDEYIKENNIEFALLAVPEQVAQETYNRITAAGVKGVLNFAPVPIKSLPGSIVSTYCVEVELENIMFFVNEAKEIAANKESDSE